MFRCFGNKAVVVPQLLVIQVVKAISLLFIGFYQEKLYNTLYYRKIRLDYDNAAAFSTIFTSFSG